MRTDDIDGLQFVLAVDDVRRRYVAEGLKPGKEHWSYSTPFRRRLFADVRDRYCERVGCQHSEFPFSEDAVVMVNTRWRKDGFKNQERARLDRELESRPPKPKRIKRSRRVRIRVRETPADSN